ncbi:MAG: redox-regulated ATPase YchF [Candidatus Nanohaloarchaea archaeon]|nr:redox-regulated ATPase YchF [Candidatus Nanohaloarchaea archaeon]
MKLGIVGKPNTGKSTLFEALTLKSIEKAGYPFTTIEPNMGVAFASADCPCRELEVSCDPNNSKCRDGTRFVPVNLLDIAGLVPGASEGKGMGNEFLDSVREADALVHVLDCAGKTNEKGEPAEDYDVLNDVKFVEEEFDLWMRNLLEESWDSWMRKLRSTDSSVDQFLADKLSGLGIKLEHIRETLRDLDISKKPDSWDEEDIESFVSRLREVSKPTVFACNKIDLPGAEENLESLRDEYPEEKFVPVSAESELALRKAAEAGKIDYLPGSSGFEVLADLSEKQEKALERIREEVLERFGTTGVQELIDTAVFDLLNMIVVYPVEDESSFSDQKGNVLPDAVLVEKGSTPVDLAYAIHSDIGDSYVKAVDARTGRTLSKDHELEDGDIVRIVV